MSYIMISDMISGVSHVLPAEYNNYQEVSDDTAWVAFSGKQP